MALGKYFPRDTVMRPKNNRQTPGPCITQAPQESVPQAWVAVWG